MRVDLGGDDRDVSSKQLWPIARGPAASSQCQVWLNRMGHPWLAFAGKTGEFASEFSMVCG